MRSGFALFCKKPRSRGDAQFFINRTIERTKRSIEKLHDLSERDQPLHSMAGFATTIHSVNRVVSMFVVAVTLSSGSASSATVQLAPIAPLQRSFLARCPASRFGTTTAPRPFISEVPVSRVSVLSIHGITRRKNFGLTFARPISNLKIIEVNDFEHMKQL